jgi:hypothetical protein
MKNLREPDVTLSTYAAAFAICLGHQPISVGMLPRRPGQTGRSAVEFRFDASARSALADYFHGESGATLVPVHDYVSALSQAYGLAREARLAEF